MKRGRLPLTSLRSFEAAGRHLSFSRAAEELFVSQAAISRQVRELEALIGQPLFVRLHRRVVLTDIGGRLLAQLTRSFDEIDRRLTEILAAPRQSVVTVSTEPFLAGSWLLPRLNRFQAIRPDVDVSVEVGRVVVDFRGSGKPDLAIRHSFDKTSWPRTQSRRLFESRGTPLIAPALLAAGPVLRQPADILKYTLLHEERRDYWSQWLEAAGIVDAKSQGGLLFPDGAMAAKAAVLGQGITLGDAVLDSQDVAAGRLVQPFALSIPFGAYWLVAPDFELLSGPARAFADWLMTESARARDAV
jgi:LysR family transcriptional regulator, glycine cleavage system transcriptional activator